MFNYSFAKSDWRYETVSFYKKLLCINFIVLLLTDINVLSGSSGNSKMSFWNNTKKGANVFNQKIDAVDIKAAQSFGITFVRLAPDKFLTKKKDFLIGDADNYSELVSEDLSYLKEILDMYFKENVSVVLTMLSLPGSRWKQLNGDKDDLRIWSDIKYQKQSAKFWHDLAYALKDHPAIIGYNILNEPHPERIYDISAVHIHEIRQKDVQKKLFEFYELVINSIRKIDKETPIILDSSAYGDPNTFKYFIPHKDTKILYSFHMYEPYEYTDHKTNKGRFSYPGKIQGKYWDKKTLNDYMKPVVEFQENNKISSNRILIGEFGGDRFAGGLPEYFKNLISIFREEKWHFAFYAFREDRWDRMDYELGDQKLTDEYWKAIESGKTPKLDRKSDYPQFKALLEL
jgi:hypothetical protein